MSTEVRVMGQEQPVADLVPGDGLPRAAGRQLEAQVEALDVTPNTILVIKTRTMPGDYATRLATDLHRVIRERYGLDILVLVLPPYSDVQLVDLTEAVLAKIGER